MPQFFVDMELNPGEEAVLSGAEARHIAQSLRLAPGEWLVLSDGRGRSFKSVILSSSPMSVKARVVEEITSTSPSVPPALALSLIKGDRFEWAVRKSVEVGCRRIIPFVSSRTVPQYAAGADERKLARWRKIAKEAAIQSGLPFVPAVDAPVRFEKLLEAGRGFDEVALFYEGEEAKDVRSFFRGLGRRKPEAGDLLIIGPEGGFSNEEIEKAGESGALSLSLGRQILRVETAAVVALALWQYELGNMDAM